MITLAPLALSLAGLLAVSLAPPAELKKPEAKQPGDAPASPAKVGKLVDAVLYATRGDNRIHVLSATDLKPLASIDAGLGAHEIGVSRDGRFAIGSAYGGPGPGHQPADNRLVVIDLAKGAVHRTIDLGAIKRPNDVAFLPTGGSKGAEAIVTAEQPPRLLRVNAESGEFRAIELTRKTGHMLALAPSGKEAYVAHVMPGGLTIVDLEADKAIATIDLPVGAEGLACLPDGSRAFVACNRSEVVCVVDLKKREASASIDVKGFPFRVRVAPDGSLVAVSCPNAQAIAFIDPKENKEIARVGVTKQGEKEDAPAPPAIPTALAFTPDSKRLVVLCEGSAPEIVVIDVAERKVATRTRIEGPMPDALTVGRVAARAGDADGT